jgi:hypothetical protein
MATRLVLQNGRELVVLEAHADVQAALENVYGEGFATLTRDQGDGGELAVNPTTVAYVEPFSDLTQIGHVAGRVVD